jgi:hypothetical protein
MVEAYNCMISNNVIHHFFGRVTTKLLSDNKSNAADAASCAVSLVNLEIRFTTNGNTNLRPKKPRPREQPSSP